MTYMVIEHFRPGKVKEMYQRFSENGRMLPEGVVYVNSWIDQDFKRCYQVMESDSRAKLQEWINKWKDLVDIEVIPVVSSAQAKEQAMKN
jgi:hypothetical protein